VRAAFEVRLYAWSATGTRLRLVLQHLDRVPNDDAWLRRRWTAAGGASTTPSNRLHVRLTSLAGFMQTLLQRLARHHNRVQGTRGSIWGRRYRACLLGDDPSVLAASVWCEAGDRDDERIGGSIGLEASEPPVLLASPPLRIGPDGDWYATDEGSPGLMPPPSTERSHWVARVAADIADDLPAYRHALEHGWALGRPESLTGALQRLGREVGRGRSRRLHDLNDHIGLCGVWG
jgi:hypothetical protein